MKKAGFNQRKWSTNSHSLAKLTPFNLETEPFNTHSVLGMLWNPKEDTLSLKITDELPYPVKFTKRIVLSLLSRIFDPLGLYLPSTIRFRWFFSSLISSLSKWDEPLSEDQVPRFKTLLDDHRKIGSHTLPRCICPKIKENMRIHVFSDASSIAYGACVYLQYTDPFNKSSKLNLLRSRAKICTKNQMSIPRLELAATIVGVRLYENIVNSDPFLNSLCVEFWTDSMASLRWIQGSKQWPPYIENRVSIIRKVGLTNNFHYICSEANPADVLTRGTDFEKLIKNSLWWNGPNLHYLDLSDLQISTFKIITNAHGILKQSLILIDSVL